MPRSDTRLRPLRILVVLAFLFALLPVSVVLTMRTAHAAGTTWVVSTTNDTATPSAGNCIGSSLACGIAWIITFLVALGRGDAATKRAVGAMCCGWWIGWLAITGARAAYRW